MVKTFRLAAVAATLLISVLLPSVAATATEPEPEHKYAHVLQQVDENEQTTTLLIQETGSDELFRKVETPTVDIAAVLENLSNNTNITHVEVDSEITIAYTPNDEDYPLQWPMWITNTDDVWDTTTGAPSITVAVIDTGVTEQSETTGQVVTGFDFYNDDPDPSDDHGHGTNVAGVIAGIGDNSTGHAGVCWECKIMPLKALGSDGTGPLSGVADAIIYATNNNADIINLSLGTSFESQIMEDAVDYAVSNDVLVIAAAGNLGTSAPVWPAADPDTIGVIGTTSTDTRYSWSSYGTWNDMAAPGCNMTQNLSGTVGWFCGSSSAAPFLAGVAGLYKAENPTATLTQIRDAIQNNAVPIETGLVAHGRVDSLATLGVQQNPAVTITSPPDGSYVQQTQQLVFNWANTPPGDIQTVTIDGTTHTVGSTYTWDTTTVADGPVTITAEIETTGGTTVASDTITVTVDNTLPDGAWVNPQPGGTLNRTEPVTLEITPQDSSGILRVDFFDNTKWIGYDVTSPWRVPWTPTNEGPTELKAKITDMSGKIRYIAVPVTVDGAPQIVWNTPDPDQFMTGTVTIQATITDGGTVTQASLFADSKYVGDAAVDPNTGATTWTVPHTTLGSGPTTLKIKATDDTNLVRYSTGLNITVDSPPQTAITSVTQDAVVPQNFTVSGTATDDQTTVTVDLFYNTTWLGQTVTTDGTWAIDVNLGGGTGVLKAKATDSTGNVRYSTGVNVTVIT